MYIMHDIVLQGGRRRSNSSSVGSRVLTILDRFALRAYDEKAQPELKIKGLSKSRTRGHVRLHYLESFGVWSGNN